MPNFQTKTHYDFHDLRANVMLNGLRSRRKARRRARYPNYWNPASKNLPLIKDPNMDIMRQSPQFLWW